MDKIILLTGGGDLPKEVIQTLKTKKIPFFCIAFQNNLISKSILNYSYKIINFGKIITELKKLYLLDFNSILLIGNLNRPILKHIRPDINSIKLIPKFTKVLFQGGDNNILNFSINHLQELGFKILDLRKVIPDSFLGSGNQTKIKLTDTNKNDIKKGKLILDNISKFDIGQSIIVQSGNVVGIEAIQGTDQLMKETSTFFEKDSKPILIKLAKIKQNLKADLPTIGYKTVLNCKKYGIKGIAYSANKTLFLKKRKIIDFCNLNNIFLFGI